MDSETLESFAVQPKRASETQLIQSTTLRQGDHSAQTTTEKRDIETGDTDKSLGSHLRVKDETKVELVGTFNGRAQEAQSGENMALSADHHDQGNADEVANSIVIAHENVKNPAISTRTFHETVLLVPQSVNTDIHATGICCPGDLTYIHRILGKLPGVESVDASLLTRNINVKHDPNYTSPADLLSTLNGAGFQASLGKRATTTSESTEMVPIDVVLSGILIVISLSSHSFFRILCRWHGEACKVEWFKFVALGAVAVGGPRIILRAIASLRRRMLDINVLTVAACACSLAIGQYVDAGFLVSSLVLLQFARNKRLQRYRHAIAYLHEVQPEFAISASTHRQIPIENIAVDDVLVVKPGDRVAVDGVIISSASFLDKSRLTHESRPVAQKEGDVVYSGSVNRGNGSLHVKATSTVAESTVALLSKKLEEEYGTRAKVDRIFETFAKFYTPLIVFFAILVATVPFTVEPLEWKERLELAIVFFANANPCAFIFITLGLAEFVESLMQLGSPS